MSRMITSGALGLLVGVFLTLVGHFFALVDFPSPYNGFGDDVYAIIIDVALGAFLSSNANVIRYFDPALEVPGYSEKVTA